MPDITQLALSGGNFISYPLPTATGGLITSEPKCTPKSNSQFFIGSIKVTCKVTNFVNNTGKTSFMVTVNPVQNVDQTISVKVGKEFYKSDEPVFVTGSVGKITGELITLFVKDNLDDIVLIEQTTPKAINNKYSVVLPPNHLWINNTYFVDAKYGNANAIDSFNFELIPEEKENIPTQNPTSLTVSTNDPSYVLGLPVEINLELIGAKSGESILLEILDPQNKQIWLQSLNTDRSGMADIVYQSESSLTPGIYSISVHSLDWNFKNSATFNAIAQMPDMTIGNVLSTNQNGTNVNSFNVGDMGYFQTPVISNSVTDVLITVNIIDSQNTPLGLAYFDSKIIDDSFDIVLGLQIPEDATPGMATVYVNTYTDWPENGGVQILSEQISYIDIEPSSTSDLIVSTNSTAGS